MKRVCLIVFLLGIATVTLSDGAEETGQRIFRAILSGEGIETEARTEAKGVITFQLHNEGTELTYQITVEGMENITAAHIHEGKQARNNPPLVDLFLGPKKKGKLNGLLCEGTITEEDLMRSLKGKTIETLVRMIGEGKIYVNVHTEKYPAGEIMGQVRGELLSQSR
ncbi:MAG: CHRD domain-containing protein [Nitrospirae bacterium]|nr:CHRD domain-containing protein [Nitrospirota bacterium]